MKRTWLIVVVLAAIVGGGEMLWPTSFTSTALARGRKSVTVWAESESEAVSTAKRQNPGWNVIYARKDSPNEPKSRSWTVAMEQGGP
jgi:hypothetical protein